GDAGLDAEGTTQAPQGERGEGLAEEAEAEVLRVLQGPHRLRRLQGRDHAPEVRLGPGQDPRPPGDGKLHSAPTCRGHGGEERPGDGAAAVHSRGLRTVRIILQQEVDKLGSPGDVVEVADGYARSFL